MAAGSVRYLPGLAILINISILPGYITVRVLSLDLERAISSLIPVAVGAIVVLPVDLLEDRDWCSGGAVVTLAVDGQPRRTEDEGLERDVGYLELKMKNGLTIDCGR